VWCWLCQLLWLLCWLLCWLLRLLLLRLLLLCRSCRCPWHVWLLHVLHLLPLLPLLPLCLHHAPKVRHVIISPLITRATPITAASAASAISCRAVPTPHTASRQVRHVLVILRGRPCCSWA
jgi:hypothetical protein